MLTTAATPSFPRLYSPVPPYPSRAFPSFPVAATAAATTTVAELTFSSDRSFPCPSQLFPTPPSPSIPTTALAAPGSTFGSVAAAAAPHRQPVLSNWTTPTFLEHLLPTILPLSLPIPSRVPPPNPSRTD